MGILFLERVMCEEIFVVVINTNYLVADKGGHFLLFKLFVIVF